MDSVRGEAADAGFAGARIDLAAALAGWGDLGSTRSEMLGEQQLPCPCDRNRVQKGDV